MIRPGSAAFLVLDWIHFLGDSAVCDCDNDNDNGNDIDVTTSFIDVP